MAFDDGSLEMTFAGNPDALEQLAIYIDDIKIKRSPEGESECDGWSFLWDYDKAEHRISPDSITCATIDALDEFMIELVTQFNNLSFHGFLQHTWLGCDGPDTYVFFVHMARSSGMWKRVECKELDDEFEFAPVESEDYIWNIETGRWTHQTRRFKKILYGAEWEQPANDIEISFPWIIEVSDTAIKDPERLKRLESLREGTPLILKADWAASCLLLSIRVQNSENELLARVVNRTDNSLLQIANRLDSLQAVVKHVEPTSSKRDRHTLFTIEVSEKGS